MPKKKPQKGKPEVHKELEGFELNINEFGEITSNLDNEKLNAFLNKHVDDKKFRERDDEDQIKETGSFKHEDEDEGIGDIDDLEDLDDLEDMDDLEKDNVED